MIKWYDLETDYKSSLMTRNRRSPRIALVAANTMESKRTHQLLEKSKVRYSQCFGLTLLGAHPELQLDLL